MIVTPTVADPVLLRGRTDDNNGVIQLTWNDVGTPICESQTVPVPRDSRGVSVQLHCTDTSRVSGYRILALPDHGHLDNRNLAAGTFSYVPERGYSGSDAMEFQGLSNDFSFAPAAVTFVISRGPPFMDLSASATTVPPGEAPALTVHMPGNSTGYVAFYDAAQPGADKGIGVAEIHDGVASLTTPSRPLVPGANPVHASYGGDTNYDAADSNVVTIEVTGP